MADKYSSRYDRGFPYEFRFTSESTPRSLVMTEDLLRKSSMDFVVMANSAAGQLKKLVKFHYVFPRWRVQHCA